MIRHNLYYKLLALGVALVLWVYVNSERNPQLRKTFVVPVSVHNLAKDSVVELPVHNASVTINGLKTVVETIRKDDVSAWVNLKGIRTEGGVATKDIYVKASVSGISENDLDILANPKSVKVKLEALSGKRLPIETKFVSAPPLGYSFSGPIITPASVGLSGRVTEIIRVKRTIVNLPEHTSSHPIDDYFDVTPIDSGGNIVKGVKLNPAKVRVQIEFVEVPATKVVIISPDVMGIPKYPAKVSKISVTPSSVILEGRPDSLVDVSTLTTDRVYIEDADKTVSRDVALRLPPGVKADHSTVKVTVYIAAEQ